jgi:hypothetical protein
VAETQCTLELITMPREKSSAKKTVAKRQITPPEVETAVLIKSRRRCPLCVGIAGDTSVKEGQIAHLDQNPANYSEDNLAFMCMPHHSIYDSTTSQHKNFTIHEVKLHRNRLYETFAEGIPTTPAQKEPQNGSSAGSSRAAARTWQELAEKFGRLTGQTRADFQTTDGVNRWDIKYNDKNTEALCRLAGATLLSSPAVLAEVPLYLKKDRDPLNLWLNYLQGFHRVPPSGFLGFDGSSRLEQIGSVDDLQGKSAQLCMECSTIELMAATTRRAI